MGRWRRREMIRSYFYLAVFCSVLTLCQSAVKQISFIMSWLQQLTNSRINHSRIILLDGINIDIITKKIYFRSSPQSDWGTAAVIKLQMIWELLTVLLNECRDFVSIMRSSSVLASAVKHPNHRNWLLHLAAAISGLIHGFAVFRSSGNVVWRIEISDTALLLLLGHISLSCRCSGTFKFSF